MAHEILVHISAPASRKSDDLYRSLADAFVDFEPYRLDLQDASGDQPQIDVNDHIETRSLDPPNATTSLENYGSFPSNLTSGRSAKSHEVAVSQESMDLLDESQWENSRLGRLELLQSTWKKNNQLRSSELSAPSRDAGNYADFIDDTQLAARALRSQLPESFYGESQDWPEEDNDVETHTEVLKVSQALDASKSQQEKGTELPQKHPLQSHPPVLNQTVSADDVSRSSSTALDRKRAFAALKLNDSHTPSRAKKQKGNLDVVEKDDSTLYGDTVVPCPTALNGSPAPTTVAAKPLLSTLQDSVVVATSDESIDFSNLPFEVLPPQPEISIYAPKRLPSQLTSHLRNLKEQNRGRFKFSKKSRMLERDERGYWLLDTAKWKPKTQHDFWTTVCEHVAKGDLGWGVFLYREPETTSRLGQFRLYCWGEIVEETWLLMWLCSNGKIVGSKSKWMDAEDKLIIQCP